MVLHNSLLQTRAKILNLLIFMAVLAAILYFTQRSTEVVPFFCDRFPKHISHVPNTIPIFKKNLKWVSSHFRIADFRLILIWTVKNPAMSDVSAPHGLSAWWIAENNVTMQMSFHVFFSSIYPTLLIRISFRKIFKNLCLENLAK